MKLFFDILIIILLATTALPAVLLLRHYFTNKESWERKHKKITFFIVFCLLFGFLCVFYGSFIEPRLIYVRKTSIDIKKINKPIKVVLLADYQVGPYKKNDYVERSIDKILELKPDVVLMAGDHIMNFFDEDDEMQYLKPLERLAKKVPVYAVHGNHEYGVSGGRSLYDPQYRLIDFSFETKQFMEKLGIKYLVNDLEVIEINGQKINLFGGDSYWAQKLNLSELKTRDYSLSTIALIHNPTAVYDVDGYDVDLMLAGHTHGGQIRIPLWGAFKKVDRYLPKSWYKGWVEYENTKMYVTSGIGETGVRSRLYNRPEIVLLNIY